MLGPLPGPPPSVRAFVDEPRPHVDMDVGHYLVCSNAVVLADVKAIRPDRRHDPLGDAWHYGIELADFGRRHLQKRVIVLCRDDEDVAPVYRVLVHDYEKIGILVDLGAWQLAFEYRAKD